MAVYAIIVVSTGIMTLFVTDILRNEINSDKEYGFKNFMVVFGMSVTYDSLRNFIDGIAGFVFIWGIFASILCLLYNRTNSRHQ